VVPVPKPGRKQLAAVVVASGCQLLMGVGLLAHAELMFAGRTCFKRAGASSRTNPLPGMSPLRGAALLPLLHGRAGAR
jgi:hypothetical protein